jgi:hypothetical protein
MTAQALKALDQTVEEFNGDPKKVVFKRLFQWRLWNLDNSRLIPK